MALKLTDFMHRLKDIAVEEPRVEQVLHGKSDGSRLDIVFGSEEHLNRLRMYEAEALQGRAFQAIGRFPHGPHAMFMINYDGKYLNWGMNVGRWRETVVPTEDDTLPYPVIMPVRGYFRTNRYRLVKEMHRMQSGVEAREEATRGIVVSPFEGTSAEETVFNRNGWSWPRSYIHYLWEGVPPSREFYRFVMREDLPTLPSYFPDVPL